ncbi:MAG TPA: hypothetical protein VES42_21055, partial [Pilimelia sp.]|nr:hypothetical protein [Pilimelia sp.]
PAAGGAGFPNPVPEVPVATTPGFSDSAAVDCGGRPGAAAVVRVLRARGLIGGGARATVETGPLCAGEWQYTVVLVPGREPLAVVTRGQPGALRLVTAGTNVCSAAVRTTAPYGIRTAADCG